VKFSELTLLLLLIMINHAQTQDLNPLNHFSISPQRISPQSLPQKFSKDFPSTKHHPDQVLPQD